MRITQGAQSGCNDRGVNESRIEERPDEVSVLLPERAELGDAQVLLIKASPDELRFS